MGESRFTLTARYPNAQASAAGRQLFEQLIDQTDKAEQFFQKRRDTNDGGPKQLLDHIDKNHPLVGEVLNTAVCFDAKMGKEVPAREITHSESLVGTLDFKDIEDKATLEVEGCEVHYAATVWYWARWKHFALFLVQMGATSVTWKSPQGEFTVPQSKPAKKCPIPRTTR